MVGSLYYKITPARKLDFGQNEWVFELKTGKRENGTETGFQHYLFANDANGDQLFGRLSEIGFGSNSQVILPLRFSVARKPLKLTRRLCLVTQIIRNESQIYPKSNQ